MCFLISDSTKDCFQGNITVSMTEDTNNFHIEKCHRRFRGKSAFCSSLLKIFKDKPSLCFLKVYSSLRLDANFLGFLIKMNEYHIAFHVSQLVTVHALKSVVFEQTFPSYLYDLTTAVSFFLSYLETLCLSNSRMHQTLHRPKLLKKACEGTFFQRSASKEKGNFEREFIQPGQAHLNSSCSTGSFCRALVILILLKV